ncbi:MULTISPECIES: hypothetical protein [Kordiimonas]|jgi:hypothetical protein|uniref:hypothetical protein n=1 Tax=Kordiimonas TaxID=288021 RepID=UPI00257C8AA4|nr:hypothetical protein [Kordiimonas sp. UBA4487]
MSQDDVSIHGSSGSGKLLLILGLLGGIAIGGGLGFYYFKNMAPATEGQEQERKKPSGPLLTVGFERIAVPIYLRNENSSRFVGNYFVDLAVQVYGNDNQILVKRSQPQLQHAFIAAISQNDLMQEDSPLQLDHDKVAAVLKKKAAEVVGPNVVENISILNTMRLSR